MNILEAVICLVIALVLVATLQACQTYRECRNFYKFSRPFCASVFFK